MTSEQPMQALLRKAQRGDRAAVDELLGQYDARLRAFVRSRLGEALQPLVDAHDVLQETSCRAFRGLARVEWKDERAVFGWLCGIALNVLREAASLRKRRGEVHLDKEVSAPQATPSQGLRREERFDRLETALNALSPEHRQVILMARIERVPVKEIARRTGRSPAAVSQQLLRALDRLKHAFGDTDSLHLPDRRLDVQEGERHGQ